MNKREKLEAKREKVLARLDTVEAQIAALPD